jgi:DnaJ-class molecular chaperone
VFLFTNRAGGKSGAMRTCSGCKGRGVKVTIRSIGPGMVQQMQSTCNDCYGEGTKHWCNGEFVIENVWLISVEGQV